MKKKKKKTVVVTIMQQSFVSTNPSLWESLGTLAVALKIHLMSAFGWDETVLPIFQFY